MTVSSGPFRVISQPLTLKPKNRTPTVLGPKVRVERVRVNPHTAAPGVLALVNGTGLSDWDKDGFIEHSNELTSMWQAPWATNLTIEFELPGQVALSAIEVWNFNAAWQTSNGVYRADVAVSADGNTWQTVLRGAEFAEADGTADYDEPTVLKLAGVPARKLRFENIVPFARGDKVGLSEVVFHETEGKRAGPLQPADGATGVGLKNVVFVWSAVSNAAAYRIYLGTNSSDLKPLGATSTNRFDLAELKPNTTYFWRVDTVPPAGRVVRGRVARFDTIGLVAHWKLDETSGTEAADATERGHTARVHGQPHWAPAQGKLGGALEFDGLETYVDCGSSTEFDFSDGMTISVWLKVRKFDKPSQAIVTKGNSAWRLVRFQTGGRVCFDLRGIKRTDPGQTRLVSKRTVDDGHWHHVVATYDGNRAALYLDGALEDTFAATGTLSRTAAPVLLGENAEQGGSLFNGWLADVRLYGYGLSEQEVLALYRTGAM